MIRLILLIKNLKKISVDEYNKIVDDINKLNKSKIKRIQEIEKLKKKLEKRTKLIINN